MTQKIYSTLDLNKSLKIFQENVTKLLELDNVREWDGRIVKAREQRIREEALVLNRRWTQIDLYFSRLGNAISF